MIIFVIIVGKCPISIDFIVSSVKTMIYVKNAIAIEYKSIMTIISQKYVNKPS